MVIGGFTSEWSCVDSKVGLWWLQKGEALGSVVYGVGGEKVGDGVCCSGRFQRGVVSGWLAEVCTCDIWVFLLVGFGQCDRLLR